jgi:hypothetical protein
MLTWFFQRTWITSLAGACWIIVLLGCGENSTSKTLYPVSGEVFYKGKPAEGCKISFTPKSGIGQDLGWPSFAEVGKDGKFTVTTNQPNDGMPEGEYGVSFSWPGKGTASDPNGEMAEDRLPVKYHHPDTSGYSIKITPETRELARYDLK